MIEILHKKLHFVDGFIFEEENVAPLLYIRGNEIYINFYKENSHPNDKKFKYYQGESKGRMIGLEEAGWIGVIPYIVNELPDILDLIIYRQDIR